jgi:hypothetical protein
VRLPAQYTAAHLSWNNKDYFPMKYQFLAVAAALALVPTAASAEGAFAGVSGGYHDVDLIDGGAIFGGYVGYDFATGGNFIVGIEGNFHVGTNDIDSEYGASVRVGGKFGDNNVLYARAGYQEVNFDISSIAGGPVGGVDDTDGDYLLGVGADFGVGEKGAFRVNVDTIAFDTLRATAGYSFRF